MPNIESLMLYTNLMSRPEAFASDNERLEGTLIISPYVVTIALSQRC